MSTRVEKGGPKFKPILRSRARPSATPAATPAPATATASAPALQEVHARESVEPDTPVPPPTSTTDATVSATSVPHLRCTSPARKEAAVDENVEEVVAAKNSATDSPTPTPTKKRRRAATVESEGMPEPIDPTQVKMRAICDDPGSGRLSSHWESSKIKHLEARKRAREERARAIAEADAEELHKGRRGLKKSSTPKPITIGEGEVAVEQPSDEFTYTESLKASHYAPQVRVGANGEVVLDMESLQVDRAADPELVEETYSHVEESDQSKFTNNSSWSKRRIVRWGKEDTALFYDALRQFGQNFDLISRVLPGRTYKMCKNKFKAEDKKNPWLINEALKNGVPVDLSALSRFTGKDFTGPTPVIEARKALDLSATIE